MKYFKRIFIIVILGLSLFLFFWQKEKADNSEQFVRERESLLSLIKGSKELHRIWNEGEDSREWQTVKNQCLKKYAITEAFDESMLRCHPWLLECIDEFLAKKPFSIKGYTFQYPSYVFTLVDKVTSLQLDVALSDTCHELYLEQNIYVYGAAPKSSDNEDYQFDNFNRHIYFDQHLVTNSEVNEWIKYDQTAAITGLKKEAVGNNLFLPASSLTLKQMNNYCSFKGKQLMLAHVYDAATFLTQERYRSPYYWSKKKTDTKINCEYIFSKECLAEKKWRMNSSSPTWAGLYDSLGGIAEVLRNPIDPESNLKASSFYFPRNSQWHRLGFRAHWDGEGNGFRNFNFKGIDVYNPEENFQVGFRCMREVGP